MLAVIETFQLWWKIILSSYKKRDIFFPLQRNMNCNIVKIPQFYSNFLQALFSAFFSLLLFNFQNEINVVYTYTRHSSAEDSNV